MNTASGKCMFYCNDSQGHRFRPRARIEDSLAVTTPAVRHGSDASESSESKQTLRPSLLVVCCGCSFDGVKLSTHIVQVLVVIFFRRTTYDIDLVSQPRKLRDRGKQASQSINTRRHSGTMVQFSAS